MAQQANPSGTKAESTTAGEQHVIPGAEKVSDADTGLMHEGAYRKGPSCKKGRVLWEHFSILKPVDRGGKHNGWALDALCIPSWLRW